MVDTTRRSRSLLKPVVGALALIAILIAVVFFRAEVWSATKAVGRAFNTWLFDWVPEHPGQGAAIIGFAVVAFLINWVAHVRGRLRAWVFALVVEAALWGLFWYGLLIPSFNELFGLDFEQMSAGVVVLSGAIVIAVTGALFWFLESREEWRKYRRRHNVDDD